ncbi:MAG TPA: hypothetical protein VLD63_09715 [Anaerolineales bacterium]|nr:hypothetical protein [Anaerolineales bacterium]
MTSAATLVRPTLATPFHIDYEWWKRADRELEVYLRSHLCADHQQAFAGSDAVAVFDHVDPRTGEVRQVAGIQQILMSHCSHLPGYISPQSTLVDAVFRILLANGNTPVSSTELGEILHRPAQTILRTLSSARVYKGIRPILPEA